MKKLLQFMMIFLFFIVGVVFSFEANKTESQSQSHPLVLDELVLANLSNNEDYGFTPLKEEYVYTAPRIERATEAKVDVVTPKTNLKRKLAKKPIKEVQTVVIEVAAVEDAVIVDEEEVIENISENIEPLQEPIAEISENITEETECPVITVSYEDDTVDQLTEVELLELLRSFGIIAIDFTVNCNP